YQLPAYRSASCINETSLCNSYTLSLHDALPIFPEGNVEIAVVIERDVAREAFRKLTDHFHFAGENVLRADGGADNERVVGDVEHAILARSLDEEALRIEEAFDNRGQREVIVEPAHFAVGDSGDVEALLVIQNASEDRIAAVAPVDLAAAAQIRGNEKRLVL